MQNELQQQLEELGSGLFRSAPAAPPPVTVTEEELSEEVQIAARLNSEAKQVMAKALEDVKRGHQVDSAALKGSATAMSETIMKNHDALMSIALLRNRDPDTFVHGINVAIYLMAMGRMMKRTQKEVSELGYAGMLHDVGKARIPMDILSKKGRLSENDWKFLRMHVDLSIQASKTIPNISPVVNNVIKHHHERLDGSGYPKRLMATSISLEGRMCAIVDSYDAITSKRLYRDMEDPAEAHEALRTLMVEGKNKLDSNLMEIFVRCIGVYPIGSLVRLRNGLMGIVVRTNSERLLYPLIKVIAKGKNNDPVEPHLLDLNQQQHDPGAQIIETVMPKTQGIDPRELLPGAKAYAKG